VNSDLGTRNAEPAILRRCRPLLGTFVEIAVGRSPALQVAVDRAFAAIERTQRLMSAHDPDSELSRINAEAHLHPVKVSEETFALLERGLDLARASRGAFDFTIAPVLANWGLLPAHLRRRVQGDWRDVALCRGQRVRFARPLAIDLGGIAKGSAVDAAIASLRADGAASASVNAGGDVRVFGHDPSRFHLRHPVSGQPLPDSIWLRDAALATSSPCFSRRRWHGGAISHLIHPRTQRAITAGISVSVRAAECWLADALTKVVLNADPSTAARLLQAQRAEAFILTA
jgi:thiamine biosynthesis lipoprotein